MDFNHKALFNCSQPNQGLIVLRHDAIDAPLLEKNQDEAHGCEYLKKNEGPDGIRCLA